MGLFERYLSVWVGLGILAGVGLGLFAPGAFQAIAGLEFAQVNLVVAVFIWVMIYPMMIQIDWHAVKAVGKKPPGLILTLVIMRPVWTEMYQHAFVPYDQNEITLSEGLARAEKPLRQFMLAQTREPDLEQMLRISGEPTTLAKSEVPFGVLLPAFVLSELNTAFQIGFMLFIPFLVIDLVVASILMAMGMMMLSPMLVSLPFKLMLFVMVDGWNPILGSLATSFGLGSGG